MAINIKDKLVTLESLWIIYGDEMDSRQDADQALSTRIDNIIAQDDVIMVGTHANRTTPTFESDGVSRSYSTEEKFYLLSLEEVNLSSEFGIVCGEPLDYYKKGGKVARQKKSINADAAKPWWLRTAGPTNASTIRAINTAGNINATTAYTSYCVAVACEI